MIMYIYVYTYVTPKMSIFDLRSHDMALAPFNNHLLRSTLVISDGNHSIENPPLSSIFQGRAIVVTSRWDGKSYNSGDTTFLTHITLR